MLLETDFLFRYKANTSQYLAPASSIAASVYAGYGLYQCDLSKPKNCGPVKNLKSRSRFYIYRPVCVSYRHHWPAFVPTWSSAMGQKLAAIKPISRENTTIIPDWKDVKDCIRPARLDTLLDMPPPSREVQTKHGWNPDDRSLNVFVKEEDPLTLHRHPVAQSTDCIRGKVGYSRGLHVWQIQWSARQRGTHACVGVATRDAPLHCNGYSCLVGANSESWGWDLGRNKLCHNIKNSPPVPYPRQIPSDEIAIVPDTLEVILDCEQGTLAFQVDGEYLGVAFSGLKGRKLYPIVSCVWGHAEISIRYLGGLERELIYNTFYFCNLLSSITHSTA